MKKISIFFLLLTFALIAQAQSDSIPEHLLKAAQVIADNNASEGEKVYNYIVLMHGYSSINHEKTRAYFRKGVAYARQKEDIQIEGRLTGEMGYISMDMGQKDSALFYLNKAFALIDGKNYYRTEKALYDLKGRYHNRFHQYQEALNAYLRGLEINEEDKASQLAKGAKLTDDIYTLDVSIRANIATIYMYLSNYTAAEEQLLAAKALIDEHPEIHHYLASAELSVIGNLSEIYMLTHQYKKAYPFLTQYQQISEKSKSANRIATSLRRLAKYYMATGNNRKALESATEALQTSEKANNQAAIAKAQGVLAKVYLSTEKYNKAIHHALLQEEKTDKEDFESLLEAYSTLSLAYGLTGNKDSAEKFMNEINSLLQKKSDKNLHQSLQEMQTKYDVQAKELEIAHQQLEINKHKTRQKIYTAGILAALLSIGVLFYINRLHAKRNQLLVETNATKDKFFSIISHDLKNPAIAQRDSLQLLAEYADKWDVDTLQKFYKELLKSANGQVELLYNLLNWAQVQTGRMPYKPAEFDLIETIKPELTLVQNMAERKEIGMEITTPDEAIIMGDANMIAAVVRNLLINAVKYTDKAGTVSLIIQPKEEECTVKVSDTGCGMSKEHIQDILNETTTRNYRKGTAGEPGSGLGLIVCKELLEKHGAQMDIVSKEGEGTKITFVLKKQPHKR